MKIPQISNRPMVQESNVRPVDKGLTPKNEIRDGLDIDALKNAYGESRLKEIGAIECETCAERTYVDGSDDPGVSFKTPGKIDPEVSAAVVMSHELEHVSNEQARAESEDREVVSQSVTLHSAICPEWGKAYVAGGVTKTRTQNKKEYKVPDDLTKGLFVDKEL